MTQEITSNYKRFLLTGCDSGVYRASGYNPDPARARTFLSGLGPQSIDQLIGFAPARPDAKLYALALAASPRFASPETVAHALAALPLAARKAQDLAAFAAYAAALRGWGRGLRNAVANWYNSQPVDALAAQILRRPARNLRQHRGLLRRAHPKAENPQQNALFQWIAEGRKGHLAAPGLLPRVDGFERMRAAATEGEAVRCIEDHRLHPPQVPSRWKRSARVWEALFDHLTYRQLLRYLPAMTASGLLADGSDYAAVAVARVADRARLRAAGVNPLRVILAMKQYRASPRPVEAVFDALDEAFHLSLPNAPPAAKKIIAALDATGSMQGASVPGMPGVPAALAGAALLMTLARAGGRDCRALAFHRQARALSPAGKHARLAETLNEVRATPSRSDPSAVVRYAIENRIETDAFVIITDRIGSRHASDALAAELGRYRHRLGVDAQLVLVNLSGSDLGPRDPGALTVSGMDTHHALAAIQAFAQHA